MPIKVVFILFTPRFSGAEKTIINLLESNKNIDPYLLVGNESTFNIHHKKVYRTKYIKMLNRKHVLDPSLLIKSFRILVGLNCFLYNFLKGKNIHILHVNNQPLAFYLLPSVVIMKIIKPNVKFIWQDHTLVNEMKYLSLIMDHINYMVYRLTIVGSKALYKKYLWRKKLRLNYYGINTEAYRFSYQNRITIRRNLGIDNKNIIGIFGTVAKRKGHHILIDAISKIHKKNKLHLLILGKFDSYKEYNEILYNKLKNLGEDNYTIMEWKDDIEKYYSAIDILINASDNNHSEAFGLTIVEAMSSNCIVIASNTGGINEIIRNNFNGFLFEANNVSMLKEIILELINKRYDVEMIRNNARKNVKKKYSVELMSYNYDKILREIVENP
jgi:glycosyltransferase involved in cell wall biosynthesis